MLTDHGFTFSLLLFIKFYIIVKLVIYSEWFAFAFEVYIEWQLKV